MKSISDVVGASGLSHYAEIALIIFFAVFVAVAIRAMFTNRAAIDRAAHLPFDDGSVATRDATSHNASRGAAS